MDRLYGWKTCRNAPIVKAMKQQTKDVQNEFNMRLVQVLCIPTLSFCVTLFNLTFLVLKTFNSCMGCQIITQFKEQGLNTELYYKNKEMGETYSIIPTSAIRYGLWNLALSFFLVSTLKVSFVSIFSICPEIWIVNIAVVKGFQICYYCWFNGPRKLWLRNLLTATKCRFDFF